MNAAAPARKHEGAWPCVLVLLLGALSTTLTATLVNLALPSVVASYGLAQAEAQWVASAFLTASTLAILVNAWAVAAFGVGPVFIAAMGLFTAGSLLGAGAGGFGGLVAGRLLQGAGAGLAQPLGVMMIYMAFPPGRRGAPLGVFSLGMVFAPAIGPAFGGMVIEAVGWRACFLLTAPAAVCAALLSVGRLPARDPAEPPRPLDGPGLILAAGAFLCGLTAIGEARRWGAWAPESVLRFVGAGAAAALFLVRQATARAPLLPLELFSASGFAPGSAILAITGFVIYGSTYLAPLLLQLVQHHTAAVAGGALLPAGVGMLLLFPFAGRLSDRIAPRSLLAAGAAAFSLATALTALAGPATALGVMAVLFALARVGVSLVMPAANALALEALPARLLPAGAAASTFFSQAGGAVGVVCLAAVVDHQTGLAREAQERAARPALAAEIAHRMHVLGVPDADPVAYLAASLQAEALAGAFARAHTLLALLSAAAGVLALCAKRSGGRPRDR